MAWWQYRTVPAHDIRREQRMAVRRLVVAFWRSWPWSYLSGLPEMVRLAVFAAVVTLPPIAIELLLDWACSGECFAK